MKRQKRARKLEEIYEEPEETFEPSEEDKSWLRENMPEADYDSNFSFQDRDEWELMEQAEIQQAIEDEESRSLEEMPTDREYRMFERAKQKRKLEKTLEKGLGAEVQVKARTIRDSLRNLLKQGNLDGARKLILDNISYVNGLVREFVPEKAEPQLKAKRRYAWHTGGVIYSEFPYEKVKEIEARLWGDEEELLHASHPKKVKRLWDAIKPKLEAKYHRQFRHREDYRVMLGMHFGRHRLGEAIDEMQEAHEYWQKLKEVVKDNPKVGWEESAKLWEDYAVDGCTSKCASFLVGLMKDTVRPLKVLKATHREGTINAETGKLSRMKEVETDTEFGFEGHYADMPTRFRDTNGWHRSCHGLLSIFPRSKIGEFSFREALSIEMSDSAQAAGMLESRVGGGPWTNPEAVQKLCLARLKQGYENHEKDTDAKQFLCWLSKVFLQRWKATAVDHEKLFSYHSPDYMDKRLLAAFYTIKKGEERTQYSQDLERFPEALRIMIADGIIKEDDVDPPLRVKYLKRDEILTQGGRMLGGVKLDDLIPSGIHKKDAIAETSAGRLLPAAFNSQELTRTRQNLEALARVFDPNEKYRVLYSGDNMMFVQKESFYPIGDRRVGDIYRVIKLKANANPAEGATITLHGERYHIRGRRVFEDSEKIRQARQDANSDFISARGFTVITELSIEDFKSRYFKDFMAHVMIQRSDLDGNSLKMDLDSLETTVSRIDPTKVEAWLGHFIPRTHLETFEFGGKFGFQLRHKKDADSEVSDIARGFMEYLAELGIGYHVEVDIDEQGRNEIKRKIDVRQFEAEHKEEIITALRGQGLAKLLSYVFTAPSERPNSWSGRKYSLRDFGASRNPCEHCGKKYIDAEIYSPEKGELWYDGVHGRDLHALAEHPQTFVVNQWGNIKKIHALLAEAKDYVPIFVSNPEILPDFREFIERYKDYIHASSAAYNFWESTRGGVYEEEEEIEEDPELKSLKEEETRLHRDEARLEEICWQSAVKLQERYDAVTGNKTDPKTDVRKITHFWADQMMIYDVYQKTAPRLLAEKAGGDYKEIAIDLVRMF